ncbi:MAG: GNAT family N-acetyltransferase [Oscillospiraceae bacterium]|nr:GNAT family N-acetyltransferase [Oscillospiraceae bacterium]
MEHDARLGILRQRLDRMTQLETAMGDLIVQRIELGVKVRELEAVKNSIQSKAAGGSLAHFFYDVVYHRGEMMALEDAIRVSTAGVKYDIAVKEHKYVCELIDRFQAERDTHNYSYQEYDEARSRKIEHFKSLGKENVEELIDLEERIEGYAKQLREIDEAVAAGEKALATAGELIAGLHSSDSLGVFKFEGERSAEEWIAVFDEAQGWMERLQIELRDFKTELADVTINSDIRRQSDDYLKFADTFLDMLFSDWAIQKQRVETRYYVEDLRDSIQAMLAQLDMESGVAKRAKARAEARYDDLWTAEIVVRCAGVSDAEQLEQLNNNFNGAGQTSFENIIASLENRDREVVIVAEEEGVLAGFVCLQLKKSFCYDAVMPELTEVYVRPEFRKRGIASKMISFAEDYCLRNLSFRKIEVLTGTTNYAAQTVYERLGYYDDREKHMVKRFK